MSCLRIFLFSLLLACGALARTQPSRSMVIWMSLDGMRGDYVDHCAAPNLRAMMKDGLFSQHMIDVFPSLTFPSHTALSTGVPAGLHGITGNNFYDRKTGEQYTMPTESKLLQSEPIWATAARQNVRSIVLDWPLSYQQQPPYTAAAFSQRFEAKLSDAERFDAMLGAWARDQGPNPVRLLMGYCASIDTSGHHDGPESGRLGQTVEAVDAQIGRLQQRAIELFKQKMSAGDRLFFVVTADHGMASTTTLVHPRKLLGELPAPVRVAENSSAVLLYLTGLDTQARTRCSQQIRTRLRDKPGVRVLASEQFPPQWGYNNPDRTPDLMILAQPGWAFSGAIDSEYAPAASKGIRGNHGYVPEECPDMDALLVIWQYGHSLGGRDLGRVSQLRVHPTICQLLGIQAAQNARAPAIDLGL